MRCCAVTWPTTSRCWPELARRTAHPAWLAAELQRAWPQHYTQILAANNEHPPMVLRVDLTRRTREGYLEELQAAGISAEAVPWVESALRLDKAVGVAELPGFGRSHGMSGGAGIVSVQDAGAQLVPRLLAARPGMRVLDTCAAPGGKTGHLLEHTPDLELVAVDIDPDRVQLIRDNLDRLHRTARVVVGDLRDPQTFWDGRPFDRILVDAPCSSTGVIRRHPDIKLLRRPGDIAAFAATQLQILRSAFHLLAPGGRLLYSTCSVLPQENEKVIAHLFECEPEARAAPPPTPQLAPGAIARGSGAQLLPGAEAGTDGFYYACVEKTTAGT